MTETKPIVSVDFETRSATDLRKTGVYKYAECPTTDIWCMAYAFDNEEPKVWVPGDEVDVRLETHIVQGGALRAWNANFERTIWNKIMVPRYKWPRTRLTQWYCAMAQARAMGLPGALGQAAAVLKVDEQKDKEGQALMMRMARPRRTNPDGTHVWWDVPDKKQKLIDYCIQDVHTEMSVAEALIPLSSAEHNIFLLDQQINDRGMCLDVSLLHIVRDLADTSRAEIDKEIKRLTNGAVTGATRGADLITWLAKYGVVTKSVDKPHVAKLLEDDRLHPVIKRVLELRQAGAKSSTAKLDSMNYAVCEDGRMRGLLQYHGAATGRWSGRLVQPQNFPRPSLGNDEIETVISKLLTHQDTAEHGHGTVLASDLLRSLLIAAPGHRLMFADYSAIEARVLAWVAGEEKLVKIFADGGDVYKEMASSIYNTPVDRVNKDQRQVGKMAILGCFGPDTEVLTDRGWKPITNVRSWDSLWDGAQWVSHQGLVPQGEKDIVWNHGVAATPDHEILTEDGWVEWQEARTNPSLFRSALDRATSPFSIGGVKTKHTTPMCGAIAAGSALLIGTISKLVGLLGVISAPRNRLRRLVVSILGIRTSCPITTTGSVYSTAYLPASNAAIIHGTRRISTTGSEGYTSTSRGETTAASFLNTSSHWTGGIYRILNSTGRIVTRVTSRAISVLFHAARTSLTGEKSRTLRQRLQTYDIAYAGPRNRYTIRTDLGPIIVHNCGYGMGGKRFAEQCAVMGIEVDKAEAYRIVNVYRETNAAISGYWRAIEDKFKNLTREAVEQKKKFVRLRLKSGRYLTYHNPRIIEEDTPWGGKREVVEIDSLNSFTRQWTSQRVWGGLLTENVVQATARDIMAAAMTNLHQRGYPVVCTVHDEIICEVPNGEGSVREMVEIMTSAPAWAAGCPVDAEGEEGTRYKK